MILIALSVTACVDRGLTDGGGLDGDLQDGEVPDDQVVAVQGQVDLGPWTAGRGEIMAVSVDERGVAALTKRRGGSTVVEWYESDGTLRGEREFEGRALGSLRAPDGAGSWTVFSMGAGYSDRCTTTERLEIIDDGATIASRVPIGFASAWDGEACWAVLDEGRGIVWALSHQQADQRAWVARRLDATGAPLGEELALPMVGWPAAIDVAGDGDLLIGWRSEGGETFARIGPEGQERWSIELAGEFDDRAWGSDGSIAVLHWPVDGIFALTKIDGAGNPGPVAELPAMFWMDSMVRLPDGEALVLHGTSDGATTFVSTLRDSGELDETSVISGFHPINLRWSARGRYVAMANDAGEYEASHLVIARR